MTMITMIIGARAMERTLVQGGLKSNQLNSKSTTATYSTHGICATWLLLVPLSLWWISSWWPNAWPRITPITPIVFSAHFLNACLLTWHSWPNPPTLSLQLLSLMRAIAPQTPFPLDLGAPYQSLPPLLPVTTDFLWLRRGPGFVEENCPNLLVWTFSQKIFGPISPHEFPAIISAVYEI